MRRWTSARLRADEGFSIIEVLVGTGILLVALAALASGLITSVHALHGQRMRSAATRVQSDTLERLRVDGYDQLAGLLAGGVYDSGPQSVVHDGTDFTVRTVLTGTDVDGDPATARDGVIDAAVTVTYMQLGTPRIVTSATTIAPPETQTSAPTVATIGATSFSPSVLTVDAVTGESTQPVKLTIPLDGVAVGALVKLTWLDDHAGPQERTVAATGDPNVEVTLAAGDVWAAVPAGDLTRDLGFTVATGKTYRGASIKVQREPATPLELSSPSISPSVILLTPPHSSQACSHASACVNSAAVTFQVVVDGFDNSQNADAVTVRYQKADGTFQELALVRQGSGTPANGVGTSTWSATVAAGSVKFAHPATGTADRTFSFTARRYTDAPPSVRQVDVGHPVAAP